ncbi:hypothetical protein [Massilia endophytica]|uniref:hypothetical protein n=1 Tax=Massilia endophytica TaxID=2899220 RepID=UPI001E3A63F1|nr:hypothetical protein [Massilia endophytica]UGQ44624.1 hypothetical protein LSQ66_12475 [Massilia endophytica]
MTSINSLAPRGYQNPALGNNAAALRNPPAGELKRADQGSPVSLSSKGLDLEQRVSSLGHATVDLAQNLLGSFAQKMFGNAMQGATIDYDAVSLESAASFESGVLHSEGPDGVFDAQAFSLSESSHFVGKGTITLADGQQYEFEVEVRYEASLKAASASSSSAGENPAMPLPAVEFPDIDFPGSLADLFRLLEKPVKGEVKKDEDSLGALSLRLLKLVNREASDIYSPPEAKAKAVADAYGGEIAPAVAAEAPAAPETLVPAEPAAQGDSA